MLGQAISVGIIAALIAFLSKLYKTGIHREEIRSQTPASPLRSASVFHERRLARALVELPCDGPALINRGIKIQSTDYQIRLN
jgi:hypothetical protein